MSTPEVLLLIKILPRILREHPEWFTAEETRTLARLVSELTGIKTVV